MCIMSRGTTFSVTNPIYRGDITATQQAITNVNVGNISITSKTSQSVHATSYQPVSASHWQPYPHYGHTYPQAVPRDAAPLHPGPGQANTIDSQVHPSHYHPSPAAGGATALEHHGYKRVSSTHTPQPQVMSAAATNQSIQSVGGATLQPPPVQSKPAGSSVSLTAINSPDPQSVKSDISGTCQQPPQELSKRSVPTSVHHLSGSSNNSSESRCTGISVKSDSSSGTHQQPPHEQSSKQPAHHLSASLNDSSDSQRAKKSVKSDSTYQQPPQQLSKQPAPTSAHHLSASLNDSSHSHRTKNPDGTANLHLSLESEMQAMDEAIFQPSEKDSSYPQSINSVDTSNTQPLPATSVQIKDVHAPCHSAVSPLPLSVQTSGGLPYIPPPQKPVDSLHPLRVLMQKYTGRFSRLFKRSHHRGDEVERPNQEQQKETDDNELTYDMFEYPSQIEKEELIEDEPEGNHTNEPAGPDDANTSLPSQNVIQEEKIEVTFIDSVGNTDIEPFSEAASGQTADSAMKKQQEEPRDICWPMRANMNLLQNTDDDEPCHTPVVKVTETAEHIIANEAGKTTEMCDQTDTKFVNEPKNIKVHATTESQSPCDTICEQSVPVSKSETDTLKPVEDNDSLRQNNIESTATILVVSQVRSEPIKQDQSENQYTFIDDVDHSPPIEKLKVIENIMPKEDRQMYRDVIKCIVPSDDKNCCSCKTCFGSCCFSLSCENPTKIFKGETKSQNIMTEDLQEGAQNGWNIFKELAFPTIRPFFRDLIAISEFLIGLLGLILSIISFSLGNNAGYNIFHIILAGIATLLGFIDTVTSLTYSEAFKEARKKLKTRHHRPSQGCDEEIDDNDPTVDVDDRKKIVEKDSQKEKSIVNIQNRNEPNWLKKGWDMGRLILAELIFYPLLICDLIEFIVDDGYRFEAENATDILGFILVIHSFVSQIFYVYILRLAVLIAMIVHIHKKRILPRDKLKEASALDNENNPYVQKSDDDDKLNADIAADGVKFQSYFALHVAGQMAAQILMIVAISMTIQKDNENKTLDDPIHISSRLWFMMVAGYVFPFFGIVSFFIPTFYWSYEHPNGICMNLLSMLEAPGIGHVLMFDENTEEVQSKVIEIAKHLNKDKLKEDFCRLRNQAFSNKLFYPFKSPLLVVICLVYSFGQFAFLLTAILAIQSGNPGTIVFYVLSIVVGIAANVYVFAIAALWTTIIVGILVLIAVIIALIMLACVLLSCGESKSSQQRRVY